MSNKRLFKSTLTFAFFTLLSRIAGFMRDILLATHFGASSEMEAFLVAFRIPNFMRRLFAEGSFTQAFVPVFVEFKESRNFADLKALFLRVNGTLNLVVLAVTGFGMLTAHFWIFMFAPGFYHNPSKFNLASNLLEITFPYIFFISTTALYSSALTAYHRFSVPAMTPIWLNVCMISTILLSHYFSNPIEGLAWGVFYGGIVQLLFQIPFIYQQGLLGLPKWGWKHPGVQKIIKLMIPAIFGASIAQISLLLDTVFASFLPTGSISWLYYADRLNQLPLGIFGVALSTVVLPNLSKSFSNNDMKTYNHTLNWGMKFTFLIALPATSALICLSFPIVITLFNYHAFKIIDVTQSSRALMAFAFGLFSFIIVKVLISAFYARQNFKTPVKIGIIALTANLIMNVILVILLMPFGIGHVGLALSSALTSYINSGLLFYLLLKNKHFKLDADWLNFIFKVTLCVILMVIFLLYFEGHVSLWITLSIHERLLKLSFLIVGGGILYLLGIALLLKRNFFKRAPHSM